MQTLRIIAMALAALLPLSQLTACAPTQTARGTGEVIDDAALTARVNTALLRESDVSATAINVTSYRGRVQLSGFVASEHVRQRAEEVARGVQGVRSVDNALRITPPGAGTSAR